MYIYMYIYIYFCIYIYVCVCVCVNIFMCIYMYIYICIYTYVYVLLWTPAYGQAKAGRPSRTYIQQLCEDTGCSPEDLPKAMNDRENWRERFRDIRASGTT